MDHMKFLVLACASIALSNPTSGDVFVVYGTGKNTTLHKHAAEELARYIDQMTGQAPAVHPDIEEIDASKNDVIFLLGDVEINRHTATLEKHAPVTFTVSQIVPDHDDGFVIRSHQPRSFEGPTPVPEGPTSVVIAGRTPPATLYGVYHYLDYVCGVGFFEDGERVPKKDRLPVRDLMIVEEPVFAERIQFPWDPRFLLTKSVSTLWRADVEWKAYLDFLVKNKQNWLRFDTSNIHRNGYGLWLKTYPEANRGEVGKFAPPWWPAEYVFENGKKVIEMARFRGMHLWSDASAFGIMTRDSEMIEKLYPNATLTKPDPTYPMGRSLRDPDSLVDFYEHNLKSLHDHYGKPDMYWAVFPPEEEETSYEYGTKFVGSRSNFMATVVEKHHPGARFMIDGWLIGMRYKGKPDELKGLLDSLDYSFLINSSYPSRDPFYGMFDYFFGTPWQYTEIDGFGGTDYFSVTIPYPELLARAKDIASNPKSNCVGFGNIPELIGRDPMLRYVYLRLSWNPFAYQTWEDLLVEYILKRYGRASFSNMYESGDLLTRALFDLRASWDPYITGYSPVYRHDQYLAFPYVRDYWFKYVDGPSFKLLRRALDAALREKDRLGNEILYEKYLSSLFHTYANETHKFSMLRVHSTYARATKLFSAGTTEGPEVEQLLDIFEREATKMDLVLGQIERVWSTRPELSTELEIERAMSVPGTHPELIRTVRLDSGTFNEGAYETMAQLYRPRSALIVDDLRRRLARRDPTPFVGPVANEFSPVNWDHPDKKWCTIHSFIDDPELRSRIHALLDSYEDAPVHVEPSFDGTTTEAVVLGLESLDASGCSLDGYADMLTRDTIAQNWPFQ